MLNFKDWTKVAEDKHSTTMRHLSGHTMTLINKGLSSIQREQLKRLKLADGTPDGTAGDAQGSQSQSQDSQDQSTPAQSPAQTQAPAQNITFNVGGGPQGAQTQGPPQTQSIAAKYAQEPVATQAPDVPTGLPPDTWPNGTMNPSATSQNAQAGMALQRDVNIASGKAMAQVEQGRRQGEAELAQRNDYILQNYAVKPTEDFKNYVNQHPIDPNHWAENAGTAQKVTTALGLLFGGFKQGYSGGSNPAYDWLNTQIDRDLHAQQQNVDNQKTVLGAYQNLYGNSAASNALAKASLRDIYDSKAKQVAYDLNTPQAWANYQQFSADQTIKRSKDLQDAAVDISRLQGYKNVTGTGTGQSTNGPATKQAPLLPGEIPGNPGGYPVIKFLIPESQAQSKLDAAKKDPYLRDNYTDLIAQYRRAQAAQRLMNGPNNDGEGGTTDIMYRMHDDVGGGDYTPSAIGNAIVSGAAHAAGAVPYLGPALEQMVPASRTTQDYLSNAGALEADGSVALTGKMANTEATAFMRNNEPQLGNTRRDVKNKIETVNNTILKSIDRDLLSRAGLLYEPPKKNN